MGDSHCLTANLPVNELRQTQSRRIETIGKVFLIALVIGMAALLGRVVQLKVAPDPRLAPAVGTTVSSRVEWTRRGDLLDKAGRVIATSTIGYRCFIDPKAVDDADTIAVELSLAIRENPAEIDKKLSLHSQSRYVVIDHELEDWQVEALRKANIKGVGIEPRLIRHYPHNDLAAGIIGKVGFEHTGQGGFELTFNQQMLPVMGRLTYLRDVQRQALWIDPEDYEPGRDGQDVQLSIDLVVQEFAEKRLRQAVEEYNAGGGRMVVMDTQTGEVLAMTDVLNPRKGWNEVAQDPARKIHPALGRNRCVTDPYEPGSTFKPFIWAVATELGRAKIEETLPLPEGPWRTSYGRLIHEAHYYGPASWRKVLVKSINGGMAMIAERMSHREMQDAVRRFGFGSKINCGLTGETAGIVTPPRRWSKYTQSSVSMGHEIAVTPLQMVRAFSAFARDGSMITPRITALNSLSAVQDASFQKPPQRVIPTNIVLTAREAMKGVMEEGTGRLAQSAKYQIFGKSGTAELPKREGRGYWKDRYVASFIAAAPYDNPRLIVLCVIDDPDRKKGHFGGSIAGPPVRDVVDDTLTYLGVAPDQPVQQRALVQAN
jgi:cell division protein FtsI (penicillin-binding protein 3)